MNSSRGMRWPYLTKGSPQQRQGKELSCKQIAAHIPWLRAPWLWPTPIYDAPDREKPQQAKAAALHQTGHHRPGTARRYSVLPALRRALQMSHTPASPFIRTLQKAVHRSLKAVQMPGKCFLHFKANATDEPCNCVHWRTGVALFCQLQQEHYVSSTLPHLFFCTPQGV